MGIRLIPSLVDDILSELQGIYTVISSMLVFASLMKVQAKEIHLFLKARNRVEGYPLFDKIYQICWEGTPVEKLTEGL